MKRCACVIVLACLGACSKKEPAASDPPPPSAPRVSAPSAAPPAAGPGSGVEHTAGFTPLAAAPIAYFEQSCARCHGPYGSFYGEAFAHLAGDRELHGAVRDMVEGPARGHLDDQSLFALVAFHRSLRDGTPFATVTELTEHTIRGEMTPETRVSIVTASRVFDVEANEATWSAALDEGEDAGVRVRITRNGRMFEFDPREQPWSDAPPPTLEDL